ncbi:16S rRNA (cytosine(967)-C(5))-methyltransferase RsmB [Spiroplasma chrysopicola]|uniref:16S rRNA (cytosine(967)-C(5))-methyltransferase n=1 Tax=Spiroplasma chrysopicola DF-1 TaxID=1276227 RepID=R4UAE7_9MOLU|nr:16S rRNA (cytosine(967)-C(5))-methyltransferase RsmB [Spiroplasma chrysopicola]AGM24889.1 RNA-binding Sun protein [Spiroplasma chrysopicola DF-1]
MIKNSPRYIAFNLLREIFSHHKYSNKVLTDFFQNNSDISNRDKTLVFQIVYGTIKNKLLLEYFCKQFIIPSKTKLQYQILLWMSLYQLYFLDRVPSYAIVNEAVNIAKAVDQKVGGFINGVLKQVIKKYPDQLVLEVTDSHEKLLLENSMPPLLFIFFAKQYGVERAEKIAVDSHQTPKISLRVNTLKISVAEFIKKYAQYQLTASEISPNALIAKMPVINSDMLTMGLIYLQDEMSMKIVEVLDPQPNDIILDMCSAPGGKTTYLSQLMNNTGRIDAYDINQNRLAVVEVNSQRLGCHNIELHCLNASEIISNIEYDKILCDVPCSGFGVMKRKPEIKYQPWGPKQLANLVEIQKKLLNKAYQLLKPGGILVYSTCTFNRYENNDQIKDFLTANQDLVLLEEKQVFGDENNTDGFYYSKIQKQITT